MMLNACLQLLRNRARSEQHKKYFTLMYTSTNRLFLSRNISARLSAV